MVTTLISGCSWTAVLETYIFYLMSILLKRSTYGIYAYIDIYGIYGSPMERPGYGHTMGRLLDTCLPKRVVKHGKTISRTR